MYYFYGVSWFFWVPQKKNGIHDRIFISAAMKLEPDAKLRICDPTNIVSFEHKPEIIYYLFISI